MFRKTCKNCGKKIAKEHNFCPYCGFDIKKEQEEMDFGLLGKRDMEFPEMGMKLPLGFNKLFSILLNQIDKQFKELDKEMTKDTKKKFKTKGISISISTGTGKKPEIKIRGFGPGINIKETMEEEIKEKPVKNIISAEKAKLLSKLPKQEASTKVRRLSNKIVYEILLPGVKSLRDVIINKLENSIEIKAFSKDKAYFKLLPVNLPILNYKLTKETLILELKTK
jgi:hypothetical protein